MTVLLLVGGLLAVQLFIWVMIRAGVERAWRPGERLEGSKGLVLPPISIIVAARNEEKNIGALLECLRAQDYPVFEIVVVDDGSTDSTASLVKGAGAGQVACAPVEAVSEAVSEAAAVRLLHSPERGKKMAISHGVEAARFDLLAFTDADCRPGPLWLRALGGRHAALEGHRIIVGYAPLGARKGAFGRFQRYDACLNQVFGAAAIGWGGAYMATGRNLSYDRGLFRAAGGFSRHRHVLSGDDDLFVQQAGRLATLVWMPEPASFVSSPARQAFRDWVAQKRRHSSTGSHFRAHWVALLAVFHVSNIGLWTAPLWAGWWGAAALVVRLICELVLMGPVMARLGERDLIAHLPVLAFLNALYNVTIPTSGLLKAPRTWQDRALNPDH